MAIELHEEGVLKSFGIELIGTFIDTIIKAENRVLFQKEMSKIGIGIPSSIIVGAIEEPLAFSQKSPFPLIIRPSFI